MPLDAIMMTFNNWCESRTQSLSCVEQQMVGKCHVDLTWFHDIFMGFSGNYTKWSICNDKFTTPMDIP
jgi:hypothetical protein